MRYPVYLPTYLVTPYYLGLLVSLVGETEHRLPLPAALELEAVEVLVAVRLAAAQHLTVSRRHRTTAQWMSRHLQGRGDGLWVRDDSRGVTGEG